MSLRQPYTNPPIPIFADPSIDVVGLFTLADARPQQIRQALARCKHVLAEKPIGADVRTEWQLVREIEASERFVAVNLFNRNAWYHKDIQRFIAEGQIDDLAIIRNGVARMRHDFSRASVELYGVGETVFKTAAFNDKKLDMMVDTFARSVLEGKNLGFPKARDSVIASEVSWAMLNDAIANQPPARGTPEEMQQILEHRRNLVDGFGLPVKTRELLDGSPVSS